jgi:G3E family GTPase
MIPLCLVTGFLGSGKTTFLRHVAQLHHDRKIVYLVNDFAPQDIDGALLSEVEDDVVAIPGGSIFCRCLATQFAANLKQIPERFGTPDCPVEGVVIEASGIADPRVMEQMLHEARLDEVYELASVISIVDPGSLPKLIHTLPSIRAQIEAADVVLLNKVDLFSEAEVEAAEKIVAEVRPDARIVRTMECRVDLSLFDATRARALAGEYAPCADPHYVSFFFPAHSPLNVQRVREVVGEMSEKLYRVKGTVPLEEGACRISFSRGSFIAEVIPTAGDSPGLAVISRGDAGEEVAAGFARLTRVVAQ